MNMKPIAAYVQSIDGKPLAPMHSYRKAKRLVREGKAKIVSYKPYVLRLTYTIENPVVPVEHLGVDTGRTNIGLTAIRDNGVKDYSAKIETANKDVPKHMSERKAHRQASRRGERQVRQRRAIKNGTVFAEGKSRERILPQCEKPITNNYIINSEARFANRGRPKGWLTPTTNHLLQTHLKSIDMACELLPITDITIEVTKWDFAKLDNPNIKSSDYQKGKLFGFETVNDAVDHLQENKCLLCNCKHIDAHHHVVPRHFGGSDNIDNIAGLCEKCHEKVHTSKESASELKSKKEGLNKKYGALSVMNQIMKSLIDAVIERHPDKNVYITAGYETAKIRETLNLPKDHDLDAYCIAATRVDIGNIDKSVISEVIKEKPFQIKQFRRQDRANIHRQTERTYKYDGKTVAKNRNKRFEQEDPSLAEWFDEQVKLYGKDEAERMRSHLKVKKSTRSYNSKGRVTPGAIFLYNGKRYVMSGQLSSGKYVYYRTVDDSKTNFPARDCIIVRQNTGLVYL